MTEKKRMILDRMIRQNPVLQTLIDSCSKLNSLVLLSKSQPATASPVLNNTPSDMKVYVREMARSSFGTGNTWQGRTIETLSNIRYTSTDGSPLMPKYFDFGENVTYIGNFYEAAKKEGYFEFLGDLTKIPSAAFNGKNHFKSFELPNTIEEIGDSAFYRCLNLRQVNIPEKVSKLENSTFYHCYHLTSVTFESDENLDEIGESAFEHCYISLESIQIPNSVTKIGNSAFKETWALKSVELPERLQEVGDSCFKDCSALATLTLNSDVKTVGTDAFDGTNITTLNYNIPNAATLTVKPYDPTKLTTVNIGENVQTIPEGAFAGSQITSIEIPASVKSIGADAFKDCSALATLTLNADMQTIGTDAFSGTNITTLNYNIPNATVLNNVPYDPTKLTTVNIGSNVETIPASVFAESKITSIEIPESVTAIGEDAFDGCELTGVTYGGEFDGWCNITFGNDKANPMSCMAAGTANVKDGENEAIIPTALTISNTDVNPYTFVNSNIQSLTLSGVETIGASAFNGCSSLATITVSDAEPATLGTDAFSGIPSGHVVNVPLTAYTTYTATAWNTLNLKPKSGTIELTDDKEYKIDQDVDGCEITYTREVLTDNWMGVCLPFDLVYSDWSEQGEAAILTAAEGETLDWTILEEGAEIEAGTPFIFKPSEAGEIMFEKSSAKLHKADVCGSTICKDFTLYGTFQTVSTMYSDGYYALSGNAFRQANNDGQTLKPYRVYIGANSSVQNAPAKIRCRINGEEVTAIEDIMVNGKW